MVMKNGNKLLDTSHAFNLRMLLGGFIGKFTILSNKYIICFDGPKVNRNIAV